jgi:NodT family efflux transporter outer membrane factor (OMF) lipoprotein
MLLLVFLFGCRSVAEPELPALPVEPPEAYRDGTPEDEILVPEDFWNEFGEPRLDELVREAILTNPSLTEAEARLRGAFALAEIAGAELSPWLDGGLGVSRDKRFLGATSSLLPATNTSNAFGATLNLSWEVDLWARIRSGQAAAIADVELQDALLRGAYLSLAAQTAKAALIATEAGQQAEVARQNLESAERLAARIQERFERGLRQVLDVKLAKTEVANAKSQVFLWERAQDASRRQLENLLGRYANGTVEVPAALPELPAPVQAGIPADVIARRPDLVAAEKAYVAAFYREEEAQASLYPRLALTASGGLASAELDDLVMGDFTVWSIGANLLQPILQGGRLRANVELNTAGKEQAGAAFAGAVLRAFTEVETTLAAEHFLNDREAALQELVDESLSAAELSQDRFLAGLLDILTVLEARRRYFNAKAQLLRVQLDRLTNRIDFYASLGGGVPAIPDAN